MTKKTKKLHWFILFIQTNAGSKTNNSKEIYILGIFTLITFIYSITITVLNNSNEFQIAKSSTKIKLTDFLNTQSYEKILVWSVLLTFALECSWNSIQRVNAYKKYNEFQVLLKKKKKKRTASFLTKKHHEYGHFVILCFAAVQL